MFSLIYALLGVLVHVNKERRDLHSQKITLASNMEEATINHVHLFQELQQQTNPMTPLTTYQEYVIVANQRVIMIMIMIMMTQDHVLRTRKFSVISSEEKRKLNLPGSFHIVHQDR